MLINLKILKNKKEIEEKIIQYDGLAKLKDAKVVAWRTKNK